MTKRKKPAVFELGKMTVFYVPSHKLDDSQFFGEGSQNARSTIHEYLMERYRAYTHTPAPVKGYWTDADDYLVHDVMERFEVSFRTEKQFDHLIEFLADLCDGLDEDAIYVTRGDRSFLVARAA